MCEREKREGERECVCCVYICMCVRERDRECVCLILSDIVILEVVEDEKNLRICDKLSFCSRIITISIASSGRGKTGVKSYNIQLTSIFKIAFMS